MIRKLLGLTLLAGMVATAAPAMARPQPRICQDWNDIACYSWRHEKYCLIYTAERCINLPAIDEITS